MTRRLVLSYVSITLFVLVVLEVPLAVVFARKERADLVAGVRQDALVVALLAEEHLEGDAVVDLQEIVDRYERDAGGRVVIVDARGSAIADSDPFEPDARAFSSRPEVARALQGEVATGWRHSNTLDSDLLYVAVPVATGDVVHGAVRITFPASVVDARIRRAWAVLAAVAATVLLVVLVASVALARSISRPLRALETAASGLGERALAARVPTDNGPPEVRRLGATFNAMATRIERLIGAQQSFVADASHQLRTPLAALRLRLENIAARTRSAPQAGDVEAALTEVQRLSRLVDGLLLLARGEGGAPSPAPVHLAGIVAGRQAAWSALAEERGVSIEAAVPDDLEALTSADRLDQVLDNLIANALEVAPSGSVVRVVGAAIDGAAELHVIDNGPGLSTDERQRAFDRFWRARTARPGEGSGLGLAIVRQLVAADDGEVSLDEAAGGGLDVRIALRRPDGTHRVPGPD